MAIGNALVVLLIVFSFLSCAQAVQYQVGETAGWTLPSLGNVNYTAWQSTRTFAVGDTLYFSYNKAFHDVLKVTRANYKSCNASNPLATHDDGATTITLKKPGTAFFICGFPMHCTLGQKIAVKVFKSAAASPPTSGPGVPNSSSSASPPAVSRRPSPSISKAQAHKHSGAAVGFMVSLLYLGMNL